MMFSIKLTDSAKYTKKLYRTFFIKAARSTNKHSPEESSQPSISIEDLDSIEHNVHLRKGHGDTKAIRELLLKLQSSESSDRNSLLNLLNKELHKLPNQTHPTVMTYGEEPKLIKTYNAVPQFDFKPLEFSEIAKRLNLLRMEHLGNFTGHKSYYFMDTLAELEHALTQYALDEVTSHGFDLYSVPDILPAHIIQGCGMATSGERTQVYKLNKMNKCLSGTSEMALAGYFCDTILDGGALPKNLSAVSRCFRAETSGLHEEKGVYRVHQFTKVEMFSVCTAEQSEAMLERFNRIQVNLFEKLGLHFKLLDMPPYELGAPAYRKYDIEAWMPGRNMWGEISSCSNCTDYQAKRLNIQYKMEKGLRYAHTVNGTACAVPRLLIALLETNQDNKGVVRIPEALQKYLRGQDQIERKKILPELKLVKSIESSL